MEKSDDHVFFPSAFFRVVEEFQVTRFSTLGMHVFFVVAIHLYIRVLIVFFTRRVVGFVIVLCGRVLRVIFK